MPNFSVMTWNVENLFRPGTGGTKLTPEQFQQKLELLAGVITQHDPDVVALQEVGGDGPLADLQQVLDGSYPHRAISASPDGRGIRVAFLSKHTVEDEGEIVEFPELPALDIHDLGPEGESKPINRMSRGAVRIRVTKEGLTLTVITAHLKSKLLTYPQPPEAPPRFKPRDEEERAQIAGIALTRRMAEAVTLRIRVNALLEGNAANPVLLLGDFNDVPEAQTSLILNGPEGSEIKTAGFHPQDLGDDARLFNLAPIIDEERRFSRIHRGRKELLDQISPVELFPRGPDNRRRLPAVDSLIDFADQLPTVGENPMERAGEIVPDHAPVTARFEL